MERSAATAFGVSFSRATATELVHEICAGPVVRGMGVRLLVTANLDHVVRLRKNPNFRAAYDRAWQATIDGAPVFAYSRIRGLGVPARVTGADLFPLIMEALDPRLHRPFFIAPSNEVATRLQNWLLARGFDPGQIASVSPPFGFEKDAPYSTQLADRVRGHQSTHLFLGVGCPKSEIWVDKHRGRLGDLYAFAFGAGLEFFAGVTRRAPKLLQKFGLEWAWRVAHDPRRLFKRYFVDSWAFVGAIIEDLRAPNVWPARSRPTRDEL
jgi:N-acetylglucosaminyldiphosphoundecaprenol N-acetyl-beta-D-mannosaminyltransferase